MCRQAHNHFANVAVGLLPESAIEDLRAERIAADLANGRRRSRIRPRARPTGRSPRCPRRCCVGAYRQFDPDARPTEVAGNTVVSSVHRGAADLSFGGAGGADGRYPALSPVMGLTHGVHGIGDTVAISVHAAESAVPDIDAYVRLLDEAL